MWTWIAWITTVAAILVAAYLWWRLVDVQWEGDVKATSLARAKDVIRDMVLPCGEINPHGSELCWMRRGHGGPHRAQSGLAFATEHRKALAASKAQMPPESNPGGVETASPEAL